MDLVDLSGIDRQSLLNPAESARSYSSVYPTSPKFAELDDSMLDSTTNAGCWTPSTATFTPGTDGYLGTTPIVWTATGDRRSAHSCLGDDAFPKNFDLNLGGAKTVAAVRLFSDWWGKRPKDSELWARITPIMPNAADFSCTGARNSEQSMGYTLDMDASFKLSMVLKWTAPPSDNRGGIWEWRGIGGRIAIFYDSGLAIQACSDVDDWDNCEIQTNRYTLPAGRDAMNGVDHDVVVEWDADSKTLSWAFSSGGSQYASGSKEMADGFGAEAKPKLCSSGSGGLGPWAGTVTNLLFEGWGWSLQKSFTYSNGRADCGDGTTTFGGQPCTCCGEGTNSQSYMSLELAQQYTLRSSSYCKGNSATHPSGIQKNVSPDACKALCDQDATCGSYDIISPTGNSAGYANWCVLAPATDCIPTTHSNWDRYEKTRPIVSDLRVVVKSGWCNGNQYMLAFQSVATKSEFMTIDTGALQSITGVVTQGRGVGADQWVKSYTVQVSTDGSSWTAVDEGATFTGNTDKLIKVTSTFASPVDARHVRIFPTTWNSWPSMRAGVLGGCIEAEWAHVYQIDPVHAVTKVLITSFSPVYASATTNGAGEIAFYGQTSLEDEFDSSFNPLTKGHLCPKTCGRCGSFDTIAPYLPDSHLPSRSIAPPEGIYDWVVETVHQRVQRLIETALCRGLWHTVRLVHV